MEDETRLPGHGATRKHDEDPPPLSARERRELDERGPTILVYPDGACMRPCKLPPNPTGKGGGNQRGVISGWSAASRRRMREALLTLAPPPGWGRCGVTFTIPGPPLPLSRARGLWADFCRALVKHAYGLIWRVEIQDRGQLHWHGVAIRETHVQRVVEEWHDALDRLGSFDFDPPVFVGRVVVSHVDRLSTWPGAFEHACVADCGLDGRGAWLRYLNDHASKLKQAQVPESIGRHWGIVGRGLWVKVVPDSVSHLSWGHYCLVMRAYDRLTMRTVPYQGAPFGRRLGFRVTRGRRGRFWSFVRPDTMRRLIEWAEQQGVRDDQ